MAEVSVSGEPWNVVSTLTVGLPVYVNDTNLEW